MFVDCNLGKTFLRFNFGFDENFESSHAFAISLVVNDPLVPGLALDVDQLPAWNFAKLDCHGRTGQNRSKINRFIFYQI